MSQEFNVTLKEATQQILQALGMVENLDNYEKIYRPLLDKVNKGEIQSVKRGYRKNFIRQKDVDKYIEDLKGTDENNSNDNGNDNEAINNIRALVRLYEKRIIDDVALCKGVREIVNNIHK